MHFRNLILLLATASWRRLLRGLREALISLLTLALLAGLITILGI